MAKTKSKRTHFINPYTFVPLRPKGPCSQDWKIPEPTHACFRDEQESFTGIIECELNFITPAVIPGKQEAGARNEKPGMIKACTCNDHLAIPGSRLRGQIMNVMRALNSSPVTQYENRMILQRIKDDIRKGYIFRNEDDNELYIQEVREEILVAHPERANLDRMLGNGINPATSPVCYQEITVQNVKFPFSLYSDFTNRHKDKIQQLNNAVKVTGGATLIQLHLIENQDIREIILNEVKSSNKITIEINNTFGPVKIPHYSCNNNGIPGTVYYVNPVNRQGRANRHKQYMVTHKESEEAQLSEFTTQWVKFDSWSGQDGENRFRDLGGRRLAGAHRNLCHVVSLHQDNCSARIILRKEALEQFDQAVKNMAQLTRERTDEEEKKLADEIAKMKGLKEGDFVYFTATEDKKLTSIGRHYRYLRVLGQIEDKVKRANGNFTALDCPVKKLGGWAADDGFSDHKHKSMKSRLWVEMAVGPNAEEMRSSKQLTEKNLRILSSQPPKAAQFYLDNRGYDNQNSKIRGRKFYWHDPKWDKKMWDNEDLKNGKCAFENPNPDDKDLYAQWSKAEVLFPSEHNPDSQKFRFSIRVLNLSPDELNLLLTALTGFMPAGSTEPEKNSWCHKIGHARPFLGSAVIRTTGLKKLSFNEETWEPELTPLDFAKYSTGKLAEWQRKLPQNDPHIRALKRIMSYNGAYSAGEDRENARITYPVYHNGAEPTWEKDAEEKYQPKTYEWFAQKNDPLPKPENERQPQTLPVK